MRTNAVTASPNIQCTCHAANTKSARPSRPNYSFKPSRSGQSRLYRIAPVLQIGGSCRCVPAPRHAIKRKTGQRQNGTDHGTQQPRPVLRVEPEGEGDWPASERHRSRDSAAQASTPRRAGGRGRLASVRTAPITGLSSPGQYSANGTTVNRIPTDGGRMSSGYFPWSYRAETPLHNVCAWPNQLTVQEISMPRPNQIMADDTTPTSSNGTEPRPVGQLRRILRRWGVFMQAFDSTDVRHFHLNRRTDTLHARRRGRACRTSVLASS